MIAAQDLMVGDWVSHFDEGKNCVVTELRGRKVAVSYTDDNGNTKYSVLLPEMAFEPIPITAQILEKNGFIKSYGVSDTPPYDKDEEGNMYYSFKGEHKFWGWWQPDNTYYIPANAMGDIVVKYVHQLQHAMRLVGIKKTIEL